MQNKEHILQDLVKIIIPIYKIDLNHYEMISLGQLVQVLKDYPKVIIKPFGLDIEPILDKFENQFHVQDFDDHYFSDIAGYNRLMLTPEFYKQFIDTKYILIYQLDAFVFRDELNYWCKLDYDYIGAPWLCKLKYERGFMKLFLRTRGLIYSLLKIKHRQQCFYRVGNGGFSLRKTEVFYKIAIEKQEVIRNYLKHVSKSSQFNEDVFWGLEATKDKKFLVPTWQEALFFSFDLFPEIAYCINGKRLPFGCHRWNKELDFWNKYIEL